MRIQFWARHVLVCWLNIVAGKQDALHSLRLKRQELLGSFWCIEMPTAVILAWMEHVGFGCEGHDPNHTHSHIWYKMSAIQEQPARLAVRGGLWCVCVCGNGIGRTSDFPPSLQTLKSHSQ